MKPFKQKDNQYICEECKKEFKNLKSLSIHIRNIHQGQQKYFDKWRLENNENLCKLCGKNNKYKGLVCGYTEGCCKEHGLKLANEKRKETLLKTYGVENNFQRKDSKEKMKQTWLKKYGVDNPNKSRIVRDKIEKTNKEIYGSACSLANKDVRKKAEETCQKNYGAKNPFASEIIKQHLKEIFIEKYGVENVLQNKDIFDKAFKTRILIKLYKDTKILYQGSYEYDFLEKFYKFFSDIENGPSLKYFTDNKNKVYHSDFFIPSLNLVIEIKNHYLLEKYRDEILIKGETTKMLGYDYILIVDKHYKQFIQKYVKK
jgi:hypothetical protein